jgi:MoxR-like ATPase
VDANKRLQAVRAELKAAFIERDQLVDGALIGLLSGQHVLMLGPPGTAKSMLAKEICRRLGGRYFEWLLTKFTTPEEIFGPVSLSALERGRYERVVAGKLPEAEVAFLDEIFKANSAILNSLLTVLNERRFYQGSDSLQVPLHTLFAASNELPEEDELGALYDRFLLRFTVGYIEQDFRFARLLRLEDSTVAPTILTREDLSSLRARVQQVPVPDGILADIIDVRRTLNKEGVVASDRRYRLAVTVLRAAAVLEGRDRAAHSDLRWFAHMLWSDPEDQPKVAQAFSKIASGFEEDAQKLLFQAKEIDAYARRLWPDEDSQTRAVLEAHTKLLHLTRRIDAMRDAGLERGRDVSRLDEIKGELLELQKSLFASQN